MKAIVVHEHGGIDKLRYEDVPDPEPKDGEVVFKVEAAGVNFIDVYHRTGLYKLPLPRVLGREAAGTVVKAAGPWKVGDRVASGEVNAAYAELAVHPAHRLVRVPDGGVSLEQAASLMLQGTTAHYLATSSYPLKAGDVCLIHAGAGGTGRLLIQIAKLRGARVIATVGTDEKAQIARDMGADDVINYAKTDFAAEVKRICGGVNVIYDGVGVATFEKDLDCMLPRGTIVLFGQSSGVVPPFDLGRLSHKGSLFVHRPTMVHFIAKEEELAARARDLFGWVAENKLRVHIDAKLPLAQAAEAQRRLEARQTTGKLLLIP